MVRGRGVSHTDTVTTDVLIRIGAFLRPPRLQNTQAMHELGCSPTGFVGLSYAGDSHIHLCVGRLLLLQLLLFVMICRMAKYLLWSMGSDSIVFFVFIQTRRIFNVCTPWQHCRIYGLDLPIHPR